MKVIVFVKATPDSEAGVMPSTELLTAMGQFNQQLVDAGIMLTGEGLHPSSKGARVRFSGKDRKVIPGPFATTGELVAGFWIWQVKSLDEAIEWVKRCPNPMLVDSEIEIRPVFGPEDFGEALTPELQQSEAELREKIAKYQLEPPRFVAGESLVIAGLNASYTFESRVKIPQQWGRFAQFLGKIPSQNGGTTYGVCWNYQPGVGFDYLTGVEVGDVTALPAEFTHLRLPPQQYAVFLHRGDVSKIGDTLDAIWTKWLPNSGHRPTGSPSFERYDERFNPRTMTGEFEIWLPIAD